jgi:DUF1365 family protein
VRHRRREPKDHAFTYSLYMLYLDADELPALFRGRWLWSVGGWNAASVRREDLLGDPAAGVATAVRDRVAAETGRRPEGPVRILTTPRCFGYAFNPVSFYYCFDPSDRSVEAIVAEITNTPWNERHAYVLHPGMDESTAPHHRYRFRKSFHVSPFQSMEQSYDWRFTDPGDTLSVHMDVSRTDGSAAPAAPGADRAAVAPGTPGVSAPAAPYFDATLTLSRRPLDGPNLAAALAAHPFLSGKIVAGIYWNAFLLWARRFPFHPHPRTLAAGGAPR